MLGTALRGRDRAVTPWSSRAVQKMSRSIVSHSSSFTCKRRGHPITLLIIICHIHTMHFYPKFLSMPVNILSSCKHGSANLLIARRMPCVRRPVFHDVDHVSIFQPGRGGSEFSQTPSALSRRTKKEVLKLTSPLLILTNKPV